MNMLNRNCKRSFAKPEFLKKAQRANPRLYDIGCYNNNLALMLAPESDKMIRLAKESRSKLSDLIRPFDYDQLNTLYDLFVPQREKSPEQQYFSNKSKMSHTSANNFLNEIDRLSREYYYVGHINAILGVYTDLDEVTNLQCDYLETLEKCEHLEKELSKSRTMSKSFEALQKHEINLEFDLQQCKEKIKNDKSFKKNQLNVFLKEREQYFEIQDLKAQLQDKGIAIRMYKVHTEPNQTRIPQMPQDIRKTNKRVSFSTGVIPSTSVSRPQLKSNRMGDRVMPNNSQGKKQEVEDHRRNFKFSNNKTSLTACNDSLNAKTSNVNFFCVTYGKCVLNDNHDMCVLHYINGVNSRTKQPIAVPISTREPKQTVNQSVETSHKKTVATYSTVKKPRNIIRKIYEQVSKTCSWWYPKFTPPRYKWKPKSPTGNVNPNLVEIILFIVDSGCSKHMTGNLKLLTNFVEKLLGTVKFGNDQITPILGYGDLVQGTITIKRVYYVEGLNQNLFSVGQFYLYSITLQETCTPNPICLLAKATSSQAWLWHRRLSHLNFDTINLLSKNNIVTGLLKLKFVKDHLCSSCELGKAKRKSFHTKTTPSSKRRLQLLHMDLCGPMRVESINGKKYVLVIVDDYSRYTWSHFLRTVLTDKGTKFLNKTLHAYFAKEGIRHETSTARTPEQNGVVKRWNRTLVEAARTMLSAAKVPLFFWAEAIATTCFTQNRSLVIPRHEKTPYHIINGRKPSVKFFHIFGSLCYIVKDGKNLDKMKEKGDACIFVRYSTKSRAYMVFNKRTRIIVETIHVNFDELSQMASDHISSDPILQCPTTALEHVSLSHGPQSQENVPQAAETVTTSNELDLLFSLMFDELLNGTTPVVSMSFAVTTADAPDKCQQQHITSSSTTTVDADAPPLNIQTTPQTTNQAPTHVPTVSATENIIQAETNNKYAQVNNDEFVNVFSTLVQERGETSSLHVDSSNMHTFQHHPSAHRWTKDHPLEQVIRNPSQI
ncbi:retrovirus-related pol polyprotein from transposon TNT 1-94 [Tanacetum coccineum]